MHITESGVVCPADDGEQLRVRTFPTIVALTNGSLLVTCRAGVDKDAENGTIAMYRSVDMGSSWSGPEYPFEPLSLGGVRGSFRVCYVTEVEAGHLIAAAMWVDRHSYPGKPLFNPETEGCLPMAIVLSESDDWGKSWTPLRQIPLPPELGPPSLTNPLFRLPDGSLVMSIETNKHYLDSSKWYQRVVFLTSSDAGRTWGEPIIAGCDPTGRIFNWDQRVGVAPDGTIATFLWTYDSETKTYLNVHRRLSRDEGQTWTKAEDLGFSDQPSHPAVFDDGRVVLCWVDRFGSASIRARAAGSIDGPFDGNTELEIYRHAAANQEAVESGTTGEALEDMGFWSYGLPYAEVLPNGDAIVVYYAGDAATMDIHWSRITLEE